MIMEWKLDSSQNPKIDTLSLNVVFEDGAFRKYLYLDKVVSVGSIDGINVIISHKPRLEFHFLSSLWENMDRYWPSTGQEGTQLATA